MSYILDALRRAEAERERGAVPGIHAQPAMLGEVDVEARRPSRRGRWAVGGVALVLLTLVAWYFLANEPTRPNAVPMAIAPVSEPAVPTTTPLSAPTVAAPIVPAPIVAAVPVVPTPPIVEAPRPARNPPAKVAAAKPTPAVASRPPAKTAAASSPVVAEPRLYLLSELPDDIRRELPTLAIGGAMYSQDPANRMLIVNGQTFHEGDKLSPNLSLEQIKLKSAVLEYKGYRYGITY